MFYTLRECKSKIKKGTQEIYLIPLPLDCITGIILGFNMLEENKYELVALLKSDKKYSHIKLSHTELDEKEFKLNVMEDRI